MARTMRTNNNTLKIPKWIDISITILFVLVCLTVIVCSIFAFSNPEKTKQILSQINNWKQPELCGMSYERNYLHKFSDDCFIQCKSYLNGKCPINITGNFSFDKGNHTISNCVCNGIEIVNPTWYAPEYKLSVNLSDWQ